MFVIKLIKKLLKALKSASSPSQLTWGFTLGMILGLTPFWNLHNAVILIVIVLVKVNIGSAILSYLIFSGVAYLLDPVFHSLGYYLLSDVAFLQGLWSSLYNIPAVVFTKYNNTVVLGSFISSIVLLFPVYAGFKNFVYLYREKIDPYIQKLKIVRALKGTKLYKVFSTGYKLKNLGE